MLDMDRQRSPRMQNRIDELHRKYLQDPENDSVWEPLKNLLFRSRRQDLPLFCLDKKIYAVEEVLQSFDFVRPNQRLDFYIVRDNKDFFVLATSLKKIRKYRHSEINFNYRDWKVRRADLAVVSVNSVRNWERDRDQRDQREQTDEFCFISKKGDYPSPKKIRARFKKIRPKFQLISYAEKYIIKNTWALIIPSSVIYCNNWEGALPPHIIRYRHERNNLVANVIDSILCSVDFKKCLPNDRLMTDYGTRAAAPLDKEIVDSIMEKFERGYWQ